MPTTYRRVKRRRSAFHIVPRKAKARSRRHNMPHQIRRGGRGRFVKTGGSKIVVLPIETRKPRRRRTSHKKATTAAPKKRRRSRRKAKSTRRRKNPFHVRRRRRRARRHNPFKSHRRRRRARRHNPFHAHRRHHRRRRRHNPPFTGFLGKVISVTTKVVGTGLGLGLSIGVPKLLGAYVHTGFQRGWGGVGTSLATSLGASWLAGKVYAPAKSLFLIGGLLGTAILAFSAISASARQTVFPIEEALLAASLPTMGTGGAVATQASQAMQLLAMLGSPGSAVRDYYATNRLGMQDYWAPPGAAGTTEAAGGYFSKSEKF